MPAFAAKSRTGRAGTRVPTSLTMPITFDEVTADIVPPVPTTSSNEGQGEGNRAPRVDPQSLLRELQRVADRAERLNAD